MTIRQTKRANEQTAEVNRLSLSIQEQQLQLAKKEYERIDAAEDKEIVPRFEIHVLGYWGHYAKMKVAFKNISSQIVSFLSGISFSVWMGDEEIKHYMNGKNISRTNMFEFQNHSLKSGEATILEMDNPDLRVQSNPFDNQSNVIPSGAFMKIEFSCENENGTKMYFEASHIITDNSKFDQSLWTCERIG